MLLINTQTALLGLLGKPLHHSLSPLMHNAVFEYMGINAIYLPLEIEPANIGRAVEAIRSLKLRGVNVTIPYKEAVIPFLDELSSEAQACGAVNVIQNKRGHLIGHNTDGSGFLSALCEKVVPLTGRVVMIGAGGAARSIGTALGYEGFTRIDILDLDEDKACHLAGRINSATGCSADGLVMNEANFNHLAGRADLIINCSPAGMFPNINQSPVSSLEAVPDHTVICDVIYNPQNTRLLYMGQDRGLKTINGLSMFVYQGALTLEILLGIDPPVGYMRDVVLCGLQEQRVHSD
ncbi:shikimate dehydrogenase [Syntrophomonas erecta]